MNKETLRIIWLMSGSFILLSVVALLIFQFIDTLNLPAYFALIPCFYLLLTGILAIVVKRHSSGEKELSVGKILGLRMFFLIFVVIMIIIHLLLDRHHALETTLVYVVFQIIFSIFETKILLILNKKKSKE